MLRTSLLLLLLCLVGASSAQEQKYSWELLEDSAHFTPRGSSYLNTIRGWYGIAPQEKTIQPLQKNLLPLREKMVYSIGWGNIKGGIATLESNRSGDTLILLGKAISNKFVSKFFRVRDYAYSVGSSEGLFPYFFEQSVSEDDFRENRWTLYDFARNTVYRDTGKKILKGSAKGFRHNYLSLLYALRVKNYTTGDSFTLPTYVHDKSYDIRFNILSKETIKTLGGTRECYKVQPVLVGDGEHGFNKDDQLYLWITADSQQVVVKIKAKARLGYITCTLISYSNGATTWNK